MGTAEVGESGDAQLFTAADMAAPWSVEIAGGVAAVFSSRRPADETPRVGDGVNQDSAAVFSLDHGQAVFAVADGVGGQPGGDAASRLTLQAMRDSLKRARQRELPVRNAILDGIESANREVLAQGIGAGTTVAAVEILLDTLRPFHVGDSEILVAGQRGLIKLQTISHSPVGYAVEAGVLDPDEAIDHDDRHFVSNLVGSAEMRIEVGSPMSLAPNDTVVVATDGLFDNLRVSEIVETIRTGPIPEVAERLAEGCRARMSGAEAGQPSKPDDLTFIVYRRR